MNDLRFTDKFIAYVDIVGFTSLVRAAEDGTGLSLVELAEAVKTLGTEDNRKRFEKRGPAACPQSPRIRNDLDFQITQVSDCVLVSAEISPAGVINLLSHCWGACIMLLGKGIMCRGYVKRGMICHTSDVQIGTGFSDAVDREKKVSIFKRAADEKGTPFIEVDPAIAEYVRNQPDGCVKEMFSRFVKTDGALAALFPFKRLDHSFLIAGVGTKFDPEKERVSVNVMRGWIRNMKEQVLRHIDKANPSAVRKGEQYIRMLDAQFAACDRTEEMIDRLTRPLMAKARVADDAANQV